ncbi:MAG: ribonuclease P protein component [Chloroflexi bacterium]|nr:ribonuclease P protein component [Chloroflexota bacterium]
MQKRFRLARSEDFKRVRRSGKSYAHPLVVLIALKSNQARIRVGVAAGRTVGTAVIRNRAKRLLREAMRILLSDIAPATDDASGWDLILIARPGLASASLQDTRLALTNLLRRAHILSPVHE